MKARHAVPLILLSLLAACGQKESDKQAAAPAEPAAPAAVAQAPAAPAPAMDAKGEETFKKTCALCHQTGAAGAPIAGNKADWEARIAQGNDVLYERAIKGYTGSKGAMPAKGGNASLSDDEVKAAVDFMVAKSK